LGKSQEETLSVLSAQARVVVAREWSDLGFMGENQRPDRELVLARDLDRYRILHMLWKATGGDTRKYSSDLVEWACEDLGMTREQAVLACQYLRAQDLIKGVGMGHSYSITHEGVLEIESSIASPQSGTAHFVVQVIQHFHNSVGAVQTGAGSSATVSQDGTK
jgi:hypothetical protein